MEFGWSFIAHGLPAAYEPFFPAVIELAIHYQVQVRNPVPESDYGGICVQGSNNRAMAIREMVRFTARHPRLAMTLLPHLSPTAFKRNASKLRDAGILTTNWLVDALYENARVETMIPIIEQLPPGVIELACHPGVKDDDLRRSITVDGAQTDTLKVQNSSSGDITVNGGQAGQQEIRLSSSGKYQATDVKSRSARITINSSGDASIWVTEQLDAKISSSGNVHYAGSPQITQHLSSSGKVISLGGK